MIAVTAPVRPKPNATTTAGTQTASVSASWIPLSVRSSDRVGASGRRTIPAPSPPSAKTPAMTITVDPIATTPKSLGVNIRASAILVKNPIRRFAKLDEVR